MICVNPSRVVLLVSSILLVAMPAPALSHDLPASAHPATREIAAIEDLLASQPIADPARPKLFSFVATALIWRQSSLPVCFWNGVQADRQRVAVIADEVAAVTPVRFAWGTPGTLTTCPAVGYRAFPVRISLVADGGLLDQGDNSTDFFALVGQQVRSTTRRATVNLPFAADASAGLYREKSLHEFCHVLGCLHEHQRGLCDNDFDKNWIMATYRLDEAAYAQNFLNIPNSNPYYGSRQFGVFDSSSIMLYSIPARAFSNKSSPCYRAAPVSNLSTADRQGLQASYASGDPRLQSVDDFARLTSEFEEKARAKRAEARVLRDTTGNWIKTTPFLSKHERASALKTFDAFAKTADSDARTADETADSYRLTPETTAKLRAFVATLDAP